MTPGAVAMVLYQRCLDFQPQLSFEAEDYMLIASWPTYDGGWVFSAQVCFDVRDAIKLLRHLLRTFDVRAAGA